MASRSASYEAIIIRSREVPSGARVATLLSPEAGLVDAFVFGGGKSKLRSLASPWHDGTAWVYTDSAKGLVKLTDFDVRNDNAALRTDLDAIAAASFVTELVQATAAFGGDWADAYALCMDAIRAVDGFASRDADGIDRAVSLFVVRAVALMGLLPETDECAVCAGALGSVAVHSSRRTGAFLCSRCAVADPESTELPAGVPAWLGATGSMRFFDAMKVGLGHEATRALKRWAIDLARHSVDVPFRTPGFGG